MYRLADFPVHVDHALAAFHLVRLSDQELEPLLLAHAQLTKRGFRGQNMYTILPRYLFTLREL